MKLNQKKVASLLYGCGALVPAGMWIILLTPTYPSSQTGLQQVASMLHYVFLDPEPTAAMRVFYVLLAVLPLLLAALSVCTWYRGASTSSGKLCQIALGVLATVVAVMVCWPAAIPAAFGTYHGAKRSAA